MSNNQTIGSKIVQERSKTQDDYLVEVVEIQREIQKKLALKISDFFNHYSIDGSCSSSGHCDCDTQWGFISHRGSIVGDFFLEILNKREKALTQSLSAGKFKPRRSCPTPSCDQTVYFYNSTDKNVEYMWTIPDKETCSYLLANKAFVDPEEWQLLDLVLKFNDGTLLDLCKKLNGEYEKNKKDVYGTHVRRRKRSISTT